MVYGTSTKLHGDPERARKDKLIRLKAKKEGYYVLTVTKQGLQDDTDVAEFLFELAKYLGRDDLIN